MNAAMGLVLKTMPPISEEDVFLSILPLSHSYERQCGQMTALTVGATIAYAEKPPLWGPAYLRAHCFYGHPRYFEIIYNAILELFSTTRKTQQRLSKLCRLDCSGSGPQ